MAKAADSHTTPLDTEALNHLAGRLRDAADTIRNPAAKAKLGADLQEAADVASEHARWRFTMKEAIADLRAHVEAAQGGKIGVDKLYVLVMSVAEDLESQTGDA
jgi:hypothetical protein